MFITKYIHLFSLPVVILIASVTSYSTSLENRIDSLILKMSNDEKIQQLINNDFMTTPSNTRLGIPGFVMNDGPHGVRSEPASSFPTGIAVAATWDKSFAFKLGKAMGEEFWAFGIHQQLGPTIDLTQDPRAGRNAESGGEDPYLCGQLGFNVTRGIQTTPVIATVKHFMVEGKQSNRTTRNEIFTDRWATEHYGYNFRTVVQEGAVMSVMASYNLINGTYAAESRYLLDTLLRQRFGYPFYVVSDWAAVVKNRSMQAINGGTDLCMGSDDYKNQLPSLVANGSVSQQTLNTAVKNVLRTKIVSGMLDFYPTGNKSFVNSTEHQQIAREGAQKSVILLKNSDGILPLKKNIKVALIGPNADQGNLNCFGSSETSPVYSVSIKKGLENKIGQSNVIYEKGCDINSTSTSRFGNAKNAASQVDIVIFAGGLDYTQEGEGYSAGDFDGGDRSNNSTVLPGKQLDLIDTLASVNPNIVVVIQSGGVCSMHRSINKMKGLVYSFYAGEEAGNGIADVLFGDYNPAGRMPVTMPSDDSQLPEWNDNFTDDFGCGYRWFDEKKITPEFAFGFGLSYTTFEYSDLKLSSTSAPAGSPIEVSVDVKNSGSITGDEVVQLYISNKGSNIWMPEKELKGFERITFGAGEKKTVTFNLTSDDFYYWDEGSKSYNVNSGTYIISTGGSSDKLPLSDTLELTSSAGKADLKITEIFSVPRYPKKNDIVHFYALVKNQGTAEVKASDRFTITYTYNDTSIAFTKDIAFSIQPGQAKLIASTEGWKAASEAFILKATIDTDNSIDEWIEENNSYSKQISVPGVILESAVRKKQTNKHIFSITTNNNNGIFLTINTHKNSVSKLIISDCAGRSVFIDNQPFTGTKRINTNQLANGLYFVECVSNDLRFVDKVLIKR